jgi:hypothetical protein
MPLVSCVECGREVSSSAERCPHCHKYPRHIECAYCQKPLKSSMAVDYMHSGCKEDFEAVKRQEKFNCPECGAEYSHVNFPFKIVDVYGGSSPASTSPCPKCGCPIKVTKCSQCGRPLVESTGITVERYEQLPVKNVHPSCVPTIRNKIVPRRRR